jgi:hypothetical protein
MSSEHNNSQGESDQALLCWSETPNCPSREEFVQVLETNLSEAVIKSALKVSEKTKVTLIGKDYTGIGIVRGCQKDGKNFILTILMGDESTRTSFASPPDPSVLVIDEFISEEQESQILDNLDHCSPRRFSAPRLPAFLRCLLTQGA